MLFVGEKKSPTALRKGWSWEDGRLAGKQLFDALTACGVDPQKCKFENWFNTRSQALIRQYPGAVFGMGRIVQDALTKAGVSHIPIVHPAARGRIRKKERYNQHIKEAVTKAVEKKHGQLV